jgi:putative flippase GtrA
MHLTIKYALFAAIATVVNILGQDVTLRVYSEAFALYVSIFVGTLYGLVVKYVLDKKYIFNYKPACAVDDGKCFILYSFMGVFTTIIFWGTELAFEYAFGTKTMRYTGAVLGLSVGYYVKYRLDKRFVFVEKS